MKKAEIKKKTAEEIEAEIQEARRVAAELEAAAEAQRLADEAEEKMQRLARSEDLNKKWESEQGAENTPKEPVSSPVPNPETSKTPMTEKESRALRKKMLNERWEKAIGKQAGPSI